MYVSERTAGESRPCGAGGGKKKVSFVSVFLERGWTERKEIILHSLLIPPQSPIRDQILEGEEERWNVPDGGENLRGIEMYSVGIWSDRSEGHFLFFFFTEAVVDGLCVCVCVCVCVCWAIQASPCLSILHNLSLSPPSAIVTRLHHLPPQRTHI